mgnify:CR=1 FL=1
MKKENSHLKHILSEEYQKLLNELIAGPSKKKEIPPVQMSTLPAELAQRRYVPMAPDEEEKFLQQRAQAKAKYQHCLLYTSPSPRD